MKRNSLFLITIFFIVLIFCVNYFIFYNDRIIEGGDLDRDGFCLCKNVLNNGDIDVLKQLCVSKNYKKSKEIILNNPKMAHLKETVLNKDYVFQDYIWIIQKSTVHTCHRDNNGDFFNETQKHPSYTVIVYLEDMDKCLGLMPGSHKDLYTNAINITDTVQNVLCSKGDVIIFNANLVHVGTINKRDDNLRIQLKLTHADDIPALGYYQNFNKVSQQRQYITLGIGSRTKTVFMYVSIYVRFNPGRKYTYRKRQR